MFPVPINFKKWIDENRELLKPPVGNKLIWEDTEFMVFVVGGPNSRTDFHVNQGEEFFYQVEGEINLKLYQEGKVKDFPIRAGEIFLLPPNIPHSPRRPAHTVGLVIERKRLAHEVDRMFWVCESCERKTYEESFHLQNIVKDLLPVIARYNENEVNRKCKHCGTIGAKN